RVGAIISACPIPRNGLSRALPSARIPSPQSRSARTRLPANRSAAIPAGSNPRAILLLRRTVIRPPKQATDLQIPASQGANRAGVGAQEGGAPQRALPGG